MGLHHATQNNTQFKAYELFISGSFPITFIDHGWSWMTENCGKQTEDRGETTVQSCVAYDGEYSEKRVTRQLCHGANITECTYTSVDGVAHYTPRLHGLAYRS